MNMHPMVTPESRSVMSRLWVEYRTELIIAMLGFGAMNLIFIPGAFRNGATVDRDAAGLLGNFVGGYFGTLFVLLNVVLLFLTLKGQRLIFQQQSFETKYFQLLKIHSDNVDALELQGVKGRRVFLLMLREFRSILSITSQLATRHGQHLSNEQLLHIAYYCLHYGTGPNSSRMLRISLAAFNADFIAALDNELANKDVKAEASRERNLGYVPFEGHQSRLGHYFRHLYQTVCYVDKQNLNVDKYDYVKTIRAQLSTHEQAFLLLNSLTPLGNSWWRKDLIVRYKLVKNVPCEFFDSQLELNVTGLFDRGYFEWEQAQQAREVRGQFVIKEIQFGPNAPYIDLLCLRQAELRKPPLHRYSGDQLYEERDDIHVALYPDDSSAAIAGCLIRRVSDWFQMRQVAVDANWQRKGFGRILVEYFEDYARRHGVSRLFIEARKDAVLFYEACGYTRLPGAFVNTSSTLVNFRLEKQLAADRPTIG
jgi:N-acetylglutamate synthase-like GNAT family acetyltransferase